MDDGRTFDEQEPACEGGWAECLAGAAELERRARKAMGAEGHRLSKAAAGLRAAAGMLATSSRCQVSPIRFGIAGLRGALAAGHLALARRQLGRADLIAAGVLEAAPGHPASFRFVGQVQFALGRYPGAVIAFRQAIAANPNDSFARAFHAQALWYSGEHDAARLAVWYLRSCDGPGARYAAALDRAFRSGSFDDTGAPPAEIQGGSR